MRTATSVANWAWIIDVDHLRVQRHQNQIAETNSASHYGDSGQKYRNYSGHSLVGSL